MAQPYEERNSAVKTRRQQEDQRRMAFRRAIEDLTNQRQLSMETADYPDLNGLNYWQASAASDRRNAQPAR
ncbi:PA3496 family putative envelope integrity protein [Pseudomonas versuta]|uniref:PA3496 family putative envelope integrity protein n=1 Tax=Pseudomonas versuta TaxID=1788301 RepID=UPI0037C7917F